MNDVLHFENDVNPPDIDVTTNNLPVSMARILKPEVHDGALLPEQEPPVLFLAWTLSVNGVQ